MHLGTARTNTIQPRDTKQWPSDGFFYPHLTAMKDNGIPNFIINDLVLRFLLVRLPLRLVGVDILFPSHTDFKAFSKIYGRHSGLVEK